MVAPMYSKAIRFGLLLAGVLALSACVTVGGGNKDGAVSGQAGAAGNQGSVELTRCAAPVATVAASMERVNSSALAQVGLGANPLPALRLIMQQSGCVRVVHRDVALAAMQQERELAKSGELTDGESFAPGQMVVADYTVLPEILFSEGNAGGVGAGLAQVGSLFGLGGVLAAGVVGGMRFKEAQVLLTLVDNRTGEQIAVASGSGSATDIGGLGGIIGVTSAVGGGYSNTNEGKVVMAAIVDAMNGLVPHLQVSATR